MRRILKFTLRPGVTRVMTADEPRWLAVGAQGPDIVAWCEAEVGVAIETRLGALMTGDYPADDATYIGTATQEDGVVVHVYRANR